MKTSPYQLCCAIGSNVSFVALVDHFRVFCIRGRLNDVYIPEDSFGDRKGHAFITFESEEDLLDSLQVSPYAHCQPCYFQRAVLKFVKIFFLCRTPCIQ